MSSGVGAEPHQPASLIFSIQKNCSSLEDASELVCAGYNDDLTVQEVGELYSSMRMGGVSLRQVVAAICKVCGKEHSGRAKKSHIPSIFLELDRRYFIVENARWEFSMLDSSREGRISERNAMYLFKTVQGSQFQGGWSLFQKKRSNPGSKVTWEEIEVALCDIVVDGDDSSIDVPPAVTEDVNTGLSSSDEQEQTSLQAVHKEEKGFQSKGTSVSVELSSEDKISQAAAREEEAQKLAREAEEKLKHAQSEEEKKAAEHAKRLALETAQKEKNFQLRERLQKAVKSESLSELEPAVAAVKKGSVPDCSELVAEAEDLIKKLKAAHKLKGAIVARKFADLEGALDRVRKGGWEKDLATMVTEADTLLEKLRRLEQRKRAILELSQRVIAELKSYSKPPTLVHQVMIATYLLLGTPEKETKSWQATQILIGKTGKVSLKRRVSECTVENIKLADAQRVGNILSKYEFLTVQDTSLGCAAFYSWAEGMVEEVLAAAG